MKNTLADLNNHLFAQLERIGEEDLKPEKLQEEINRSKAIVELSSAIIQNATVELKHKELSIDALKLISSGLLKPSGEETIMGLIDQKK